jgi:hypothetical protein
VKKVVRVFEYLQPPGASPAPAAAPAPAATANPAAAPMGEPLKPPN